MRGTSKCTYGWVLIVEVALKRDMHLCRKTINNNILPNIFLLKADGSLAALSEWTQKVIDNPKSCKANWRCTSEGLSTYCCEEHMTDVGRNECKLIMDADDSSNDSFILNTNALHREFQECLAGTVIMMECHVGDSYTGKEFNNEKGESKNNSSGTVRPVGESDGAQSLVVDDCDEYVILEGFE